MPTLTSTAIHTRDLFQMALKLTKKEQHRLAFFIAENLNYNLVKNEEPRPYCPRCGYNCLRCNGGR